jgi:hypothetical protein
MPTYARTRGIPRFDPGVAKDLAAIVPLFEPASFPALSDRDRAFLADLDGD